MTHRITNPEVLADLFLKSSPEEQKELAKFFQSLDEEQSSKILKEVVKRLHRGSN